MVIRFSQKTRRNVATVTAKDMKPIMLDARDIGGKAEVLLTATPISVDKVMGSVECLNLDS